jgi:predicted ArsR family transcriptional regulator
MTRDRLEAALRDAPDGLDVATLSTLIGIHPNSVRWHLHALEKEGTVEVTSVPVRGPGRPRLVYRAAPDGPQREVAALLTATGFDAQHSPRTLRMRRCPVRGVANGCTVHRRMIDAAFESLGSDLRVAEVVADGTTCVARLSRSV